MQQFHDFLQAVDERRHLSLPRSVIRCPKNRRRRYGGGRVGCEFGIDELSSLGIYAKTLAQECLCRCRSEAHQHLRPHDPDFGFIHGRQA